MNPKSRLCDIIATFDLILFAMQDCLNEALISLRENENNQFIMQT